MSDNAVIYGRPGIIDNQKVPSFSCLQGSFLFPGSGFLTGAYQVRVGGRAHLGETATVEGGGGGVMAGACAAD